MKPARWISVYGLMLILIVSTACMTLFPQTPVPIPTATEERFEPHTELLEFDPPALPPARVGTSYEVEIQVAGNVTPVGGVNVNSGSLPPGLELVFEEDGTDTARITGIPETSGTYTFHIEVWCFGTQVSGQTGGKEYTIVVE